MKTKELIAEINDLPVEQRVEITTQLLQGFNPPNPDIEKAWAKEARKRLDDFEQGKTEAEPGEQVHEQLRKKYSK